MEFDLWLARGDGVIWFAWALPDSPPRMIPKAAKNVSGAFASLKSTGTKIGQVGICSKEMLGVS